MKKIKIRFLIIFVIIALLLSYSFYLFTEFYGYPWRHAELKREVVGYMKNKYNMDVKVERSSFNFKFDYYLVKVFDINDKNKSLITVEKRKYYDENNQIKGERLEDNYSKIYWETRLLNSLQTKYPNFFRLPDIDKFKIDIAYYTTPIENGVSSVKDEEGVYIPLEPENSYSLDMDLKTKDFSDEFLNELLVVIKDLSNIQSKIDLFITGIGNEGNNRESTKGTKLLRLSYERFKDINNTEDLKKEISEF